MAPWTILLRQNWQQRNHSAFLVAFFAHVLQEILIRHNIKENVSKGNIWGPLYKYKGEGLGGS